MSRQKTGQRLNATDFLPPHHRGAMRNLDIDWSMFSSAHEPCRGDGTYTVLFGRGAGNTLLPTLKLRKDKDFFEHAVMVLI